MMDCSITYRRFLALMLLAGPLSSYAQISFIDITSQAGLASYRAQAGDGHGPGAVFADLDGDGWADLYLMRSWGNANELYLNRSVDGQRTFQRASNDAGAGDTGNATGAIAADYDNDGDQDLYVLNFDQPNVLYRNLLVDTGALAFVDATASTDPSPASNDNQHGLGMAFHESIALDNALTAAWGDVDRDGDLDLYVGNHNSFYSDDNPPEGPVNLPGRRDVFYLNNGDGTFTDRTSEYAMGGYFSENGQTQTSAQRYSSTNAVIFADVNNDRWPDLFVTNKVGGPDDRDMLYINRGRDAAEVWLGFELVTYTLPDVFGHQTGGAMGVEAGDLDNDGDLDLYVSDWSDLANPGNPGSNDLWINQLTETGSLSFVHSLALPAKYSWGNLLSDFDNDGREDVHVATEAPAQDHLYHNTAGGFVEIAASANIATPAVGRGDPGADFDRDGWQDMFVVAFQDSPSHLYRNNTGVNSSNGHLTLRLTGRPDSSGALRSSRDAIGARAMVTADLDNNGYVDLGETQIREVLSGSGNAASTSELALHFGLGQAPAATVAILWPSGEHAIFNVPANTELDVDEALQVGGPAQLISNLSFEEALSGWRTQLSGEGQADFTVDPGTATDGATSLRVDVHATDGVGWHVQFYQGERPLIGQQQYRVSFDAKATTSDPVRAIVMRDHEPWTGLGASEYFTPQPQWQHFEMIATVNATDTDSRLGFELGEGGIRTVWFDNIRMEPLGDSDFDGLLDVNDNCTLTGNRDQRDSDLDGYGNACDGDFNNDGNTDFTDLAYLKSVFFSNDADGDLDGDGTVNFQDLAALKLMFFSAPGPSGVN